MKSKLGLMVVAVTVTSALAGCGGDEGTSTASDNNLTNADSGRMQSIADGTFRLYLEPNHVPDPTCASHTDLELAKGTAHLVDGHVGQCAPVAMSDRNPRSYSLELTSTSECGIKVYEGARRFPISPTTTGVATIKVTDSRFGICDVAAVAMIVVEESVGTVTKTLFSDDS